MKPRAFALLISATVIVVAFILLFIPVKATTSGGATVGCGTGFSTDMSQAAYDNDVNNITKAFSRGFSNTVQGYAEKCTDALAARRTWGFGLLGLGAVVLLGSLVVRQNTGGPASAQPAE
jgi:hypothetical protein